MTLGNFFFFYMCMDTESPDWLGRTISGIQTGPMAFLGPCHFLGYHST